MSAKIHELLAIRKGEIGRNKSRLAEILHRFKKPALFNGMAKNYEPLEDDGEPLPSQSQRVTSVVADDLSAAEDSLLALWNTVATIERGNCSATAPIVVDGETLLEDVPVTTLLFLEQQMVDVRTLVENIPALSADFAWEIDTNDGLQKTDVITTHRNKKTATVIKLAPATEHHKEQVELREVDVLAGHWNTVQHSGAMPSTRKAVLLGRIEKLSDAVKQARARANGIEAPPVNTSTILNYIFAS